MRKILYFLLLFPLLMAGCGSSAAPETMPATAADSTLYASSETNYGISNSIASSTPCQAAEAEAADPDIGSYFTFSRENNTHYAEDGTALLYEYNCIVTYTAVNPEQEQWVNSILAEIRSESASNSSNLLLYAQSALQQGSGDNFFGFSNAQQVATARHDQKITSIVVLSSIYSGGTHPNSVQTSWNLDMETRIQLRLEDLIYEGSEGLLIDLIQQNIEGKFEGLSDGVLFADYAKTIAKAFEFGSMTPYWYLNDTGLVIYFNQYELGPYAAGIIKAAIPYERLSGILRDEYFPSVIEYPEGDLRILDHVDGHNVIPVSIEASGSDLAIGITGEVFQVQLSEVFWMEGKPIGQTMIFSADYLNIADVLVITGGFQQEGRSFAIEFSDGAGNVRVYYLHPNELSDTP